MAQTSSLQEVRRGGVEIDPGISLRVLAAGGPVGVHGAVVPLGDMTIAEMQLRISVGWCKFWAMQRMLLNRGVSILRRFRLFDVSVGGSVLYCSISWAPRAAESRVLQSAQNKMLRCMCAFQRRPDEQWHEWISRTAKTTRTKAHYVGVRRGPRRALAGCGRGQGTHG
eukprot:2281296-Pyramimonas_sp.AAC.1